MGKHCLPKQATRRRLNNVVERGHGGYLSARGISVAVVFGLCLSSGTAQVASVARDPVFDAVAAWASSSVGLGKSNVVLRFAPQVVADPSLASSDFVTRQRATLLLADSVPLPSEIYSVSGRDIVTVYQKILDNRDTSGDILTRDERRTLAKAEHVLLRRECVIVRLFTGRSRKEESRKLKKYRVYEASYSQLQTALQKETDATKRATLTQQMQAVQTQWIEKGHKAEIDAALKNLDNISTTSTPAFWNKVVDQYHANIRHIGGIDLPMTSFFPAASSWSSPDGWKDVPGVGVNVQAKVVTIVRPWFNVEVVTSRKWTWAPGRMQTEDVEIADGVGLSPTAGHDALMPLLPTAVILVRPQPHATSSNQAPMVIGVICLILPKQP